MMEHIIKMRKKIIANPDLNEEDKFISVKFKR